MIVEVHLPGTSAVAVYINSLLGRGCLGVGGSGLLTHCESHRAQELGGDGQGRCPGQQSFVNTHVFLLSMGKVSLSVAAQWQPLFCFWGVDLAPSRRGGAAEGEKSENARSANKFVLKFMEKHYNTNILSHESPANTTVDNADNRGSKLCKPPISPGNFPCIREKRGLPLTPGGRCGTLIP